MCTIIVNLYHYHRPIDREEFQYSTPIRSSAWVDTEDGERSKYPHDLVDEPCPRVRDRNVPCVVRLHAVVLDDRNDEGLYHQRKGECTCDCRELYILKL
jgi:hypothetical protein